MVSSSVRSGTRKVVEAIDHASCPNVFQRHSLESGLPLGFSARSELILKKDEIYKFFIADHFY